jgi:hypothetical protein
VREHGATARAEEAIGADCRESLRQHMLEEAVDERLDGECQAFPPRATALLAAEGDLPVFKLFQTVGGEGKPIDGGSKGGEHLGARACRLTVGHPIFMPDLGRHGSAKASGSQRCFELTTEESGARADGHQPGIGAGREPLSTF